MRPGLGLRPRVRLLLPVTSSCGLMPHPHISSGRPARTAPGGRPRAPASCLTATADAGRAIADPSSAATHLRSDSLEDTAVLIDGLDHFCDRPTGAQIPPLSARGRSAVTAARVSAYPTCQHSPPTGCRRRGIRPRARPEPARQDCTGSTRSRSSRRLQPTSLAKLLMASRSPLLTFCSTWYLGCLVGADFQTETRCLLWIIAAARCAHQRSDRQFPASARHATTASRGHCARYRRNREPWIGGIGKSLRMHRRASGRVRLLHASRNAVVKTPTSRLAIGWIGHPRC